jgi:hypothetical protein
VVSWSKATRDLLKSFGWGISALHQLPAATMVPFPRRPPHTISRVNVRIDTQPPGHGSEPHLDFIVTDLDGMLAQLCGPGAFGVRPGFSGSEIADHLRGVDLACFCPTGQPCHADVSLEIANLEGKP